MKHLRLFEESTRKKWTKEECSIEASKYKTRSDFIKGNRKAYRASSDNGWLDGVCSHMDPPFRFNYWTKKCAEIALGCSSRKEFQRKVPVAYNKSLKNNWLDEICNHMKVYGHMYKRCIYAVEFSDKSVYVGLTYNIDMRFIKHLSDPKSSVFKYQKSSGLYPTIKQLSEYIDVDDASKLEGIKREEYLKNGWSILNVAKCGSVGGKFIKWTKESCQKEASKYNRRNEFKIKSPLAYNAARRNKWTDEICQHMTFAYNRK